MRTWLLRVGGGVAAGFFTGSVADAKTLKIDDAGVGRGPGGAWGLDRFDRDWDKEHLTQPDLLGKNQQEASKRGVRSIILVRHGQYYLETGELTDLGRRQAELSAQRVAVMCEGLALPGPPTSLVVSSAVRAMQTSQPFIKTLNLTPEVDDQLRECWPCHPFDREPSKSTDIVRGHAQAEGAYRRVFRRPASEKHDEVVVVVAHANVIRYWALRALQAPPEAWTLLAIPHASVTHIRVSPSGNVSVRCIGDSGFFPPDMVTTNNARLGAA